MLVIVLAVLASPCLSLPRLSTPCLSSSRQSSPRQSSPSLPCQSSPSLPCQSSPSLPCQSSPSLPCQSSPSSPRQSSPSSPPHPAPSTWLRSSHGSRGRGCHLALVAVFVVAWAVAACSSWSRPSRDCCRHWIACCRVVITATGVRVAVTWSGWWRLGVGYEGDAGSTGLMW
jgi:hypothetical protein